MKVFVNLGWMIGLILWAVCMWTIGIYAFVKGKDLAWKEQIKKRTKRFCAVFILAEAILILIAIFVPRIAEGDYLLEGMSNSAVVKQADTEQSDALLPQMEEQSAVPETPKEETKEPSKQEPSAAELLEQAVEEKLAQMTIEEKVAQMFMITPEALTDYAETVQASDVTYQSLKEYPVGGIIYFADNIVDKEQLKEMTGKMQEYSEEIIGLPLLLGIDEEGGSVARIAKNDKFGITNLPDMWEIGQSGDVTKAYEAGKKIGTYLKEYGLNLDFAPVADVWTNPQNQVIGKRAFGSDAKTVAEMDEAVIKGLDEAGIYACLKHFPGHGDTANDTHSGYAYTDKSLEQLKENELIPFQQGIDNGISFIMVSHIGVPNVTEQEIPASMSQVMIEEILRKRMKFQGIVITDALNMGAITEEYDSAAAAAGAVYAGVDMILMPKDFKQAYEAVLRIVLKGDIAEERIEESVKRILRVKLKLMI